MMMFPANNGELFCVIHFTLLFHQLQTEALGKTWSAETSSAKNYESRVIPKHSRKQVPSSSQQKQQSTWSEKEWEESSYQRY